MDSWIFKIGMYKMYILSVLIYYYLILFGQIIATSHDLVPNGGLSKGNLLFQGNLGWRNMISNLARYYCIYCHRCYIIYYIAKYIYIYTYIRMIYCI